MVEKGNASNAEYAKMMGTPLAQGKMAAPLHFDVVLEKNKKVHAAAMKKLVIVSIVSVFASSRKWPRALRGVRNIR